NLLEARRALKTALHDDETIATAATEARQTYRLDHLLITRGADGMTLATDGEILHLPAEGREVADVTRAGDTVVAVLGRSLAEGREIADACRLASIAAGIAVGHRGCYVVKAAELDQAQRGLSPKILGRDAARRWALDRRAAGQKIVFTNGCFDILH